MMSYEVDYIYEAPCKCGKNFVVEESSSNDWLQRRVRTYINCKECAGKYHLETSNGLLYMIPNGETILVSSGNNWTVGSKSFEEYIAKQFRLQEIKNAYEVICNATTYSKINNETARRIMRCHKDQNNTMKMSIVRESLKSSIEKYGNFKNSKDAIDEEYKKNKAEMERRKPDILKRSYGPIELKRRN
jgi:hypothetical protein